MTVFIEYMINLKKKGKSNAAHKINNKSEICILQKNMLYNFLSIFKIIETKENLFKILIRCDGEAKGTVPRCNV